VTIATRRALRLLILLAIVVVALGSAASSALAAAKVKVFFARDDRLQTVERVVPDGGDRLQVAVSALFRGPTGAERRDGIRSAIPKGVAVQEIVVANGVAFLRLPETFAVGGAGDIVDLRLAQIAHTVTGAADVVGVQILLGDEPVPAPGADPGAVITLGSLTKREIIGPIPVGMAALQRRLVQLRYLSPGAVNGRLDYRTAQALVAFQAWEGLSRTGVADLATRQRATIAKIPVPRVLSQSRRMEVNRYKGVLLLIERGQVVRAVHISTGAGGKTPRGTFHILRKERMSFSRPFKVFLPYASYFSGGFAFHEYPNVPAYSASHGCIRIGYPEAPGVYAFAAFGTLVSIT
jgi:lipoprotein-anchoring transpeptidase ErfK/SrfK